MKIERLKVKDKYALAFSSPLPSSEERGDLLLVTCDKGFAMCAIMDDRKMEDSDIVAVMLPARDMDGILDARVRYASPKARELGIEAGMRGEDALYLLLE